MPGLKNLIFLSEIDPKTNGLEVFSKLIKIDGVKQVNLWNKLLTRINWIASIL